MVDIYNLRKEGFLEKRGKTKLVWKKYWCVLDGKIFKSYQSKENSSGDLEKFALNMKAVQTIKKNDNIDHGYVFEFITKMKIFAWSAESENLRDEWIKVLLQVIQSKCHYDSFQEGSRLPLNRKSTFYTSVESLKTGNFRNECLPYAVVNIADSDSKNNFTLPSDYNDDDEHVVLRNSIYQDGSQQSPLYAEIPCHRSTIVCDSAEYNPRLIQTLQSFTFEPPIAEASLEDYHGANDPKDESNITYDSAKCNRRLTYTIKSFTFESPIEEASLKKYHMEQDSKRESITTYDSEEHNPQLTQSLQSFTFEHPISESSLENVANVPRDESIVTCDSQLSQTLQFNFEPPIKELSLEEYHVADGLKDESLTETNLLLTSCLPNDIKNDSFPCAKLLDSSDLALEELKSFLKKMDQYLNIQNDDLENKSNSDGENNAILELQNFLDKLQKEYIF